MTLDRTLGQYHLIDVIATGGMGQLHLATKRGLEGFTKVAAVKCIRPELAETTPFRQMFLDEARVAARLDHPNIVTTYELGIEDGTYFIAMEYLPGEDLGAALARSASLGRPVPFEVAIDIAWSCAQGLHFAHELPGKDGRPTGLVHRDVSPPNVVITYHGAVKLLDFGIAKMRNTTRTSQVGGFRGKLRYAAPEQVAGGRIDRRTDVFGLGIILWECLTGSVLFDGSTDAEIVDAIQHRTIDPPSKRRPDVMAELERIVMRALDRDPERRYQTARDLAGDLGRLSIGRGPDGHSRIAHWLESLFGPERSALKVGIARGQLEGSVRALSVPDGPVEPTQSTTLTSGFKTAWNSELPGRPSVATGDLPARPFVTESLPPVPPSRPKALIVGGLSVAGLIAAVVSFAMFQKETPAVEAPVEKNTYVISVSTTPPGAHVYVDGAPTGRRAPTVLRGFTGEGGVVIRTTLPGYADAEKTCTPSLEGTACNLAMQRTTAVLDVQGIPEGARLYIDGEERSTKRPEVPIGERKVRIENEGDLIFDGVVMVQSEGAVLRLGGR